MSRLRLVAVGAALILVDLSIQGRVDVLPDVLGALLIVVALRTGLARQGRPFRLVVPFSVLLLVSTVIAVPAGPSRFDAIAESVVGLVFGVTLALVFFGIARHCAQTTGRPAHQVAVAAWLNVGVAVLSSVAVGVAIVRGSLQSDPVTIEGGGVPIAIVLGIVLVATVVWMLVLLLRASKETWDGMTRSDPPLERSGRWRAVQRASGVSLATGVVSLGLTGLFGGATLLGSTADERLAAVDRGIATELSRGLGPVEKDAPPVFEYAVYSTSEGPSTANWLIGAVPAGITAIEIRGRRTQLSSHKVAIKVGLDGPARAKLIGPTAREWRDHVGDGRVLFIDDEGAWVRLPGDWMVSDSVSNTAGISANCEDLAGGVGTGCTVVASEPPGGVWRIASALDQLIPRNRSELAALAAQGLGENHPRQIGLYRIPLATAMDVLGFQVELAGQEFGLGPQSTRNAADIVEVITASGRFAFPGYRKTFKGAQLVLVREPKSGDLVHFQVRERVLKAQPELGKRVAVPN